MLSVPNKVLRRDASATDLGRLQDVGAKLSPTHTKVALGRGRGLVDWVRLGASGKDLAGTGGRPVRVDAALLSAHCRRDDVWTLISGNVYNVTAYMDFHPGGELELMRAAGTDGTQLFADIHPWVNAETMLKACFVGQFVGSKATLRHAKRTVDPDESPPNSVASSSSPKKEDVSVETIIDGAEVTCRILTDLPTAALKNWMIERVDKEGYRLLLQNVSPSARDEECIMNTGALLLRCKENRVCFAGAHFASNQIRLNAELEETRPSVVFRVDLRNNEAARTNSLSIKCHRRPVIERRFRPMTVASVTRLTHDTHLLQLDVPAGCLFSVPLGHHVNLRCPSKPSLSRPYTPVSPLPLADHVTPHFLQRLDLLVKAYKDGQLSPALCRLSVGDVVEVSDPAGTFAGGRLAAVDRLVLLAAGTGLTPMLRLTLAWARLNKPTAPTLILFNKTEEDIVWQTEWRQLEEAGRLVVCHVLSKASTHWTGQRGRISADLLKQQLGNSLRKPLICICGPDPFTELAARIVDDMGYSGDSVHVFQG